MKKKLLLVMLTFLLTLACIAPMPAFAVQGSNQPDAQSSVLSDEFIYYYRLIDGKKYYRIWNATDLRWETPWLPCG